MSLPSWELFEEQPEEYRQSVLPPEITARVTVEAGATLGWERYAGLQGTVIGLERFGASAPGRNGDEGARIHRRARGRCSREAAGTMTGGQNDV